MRDAVKEKRQSTHMAKQARPQGLIVGSRKHQIKFVRPIDATGIKPVIDRSFGLDAIAGAGGVRTSPAENRVLKG
jgi:hypothetical protein